MTFSKPLTSKEKSYILENAKLNMPTQRIAENLGRSVRAVQKVIAENRAELKGGTGATTLHTVETSLARTLQAKQKSKAPKTREECLLEAKEILRSHLLEADTRSVSQIAKEYRSLLQEIEELGTKDHGSAHNKDPIRQKFKLMAASSL